MDVGRIADAAVDMGRAASELHIGLDDVAIVDRLVAGFPLDDQLRLAQSMLRDPRVANSPLSRGPLATIQRAVEPLEAPTSFSSLVLKQLRDNVDTEIKRIDGVIPSNGYDGHPDYAVIGRISDGLDKLEKLGAFGALAGL